ncbi:MAG TPA: type IV toxin-antitoxin system AbiEi family antitoxin domain-containing protein [Solirubrobacteraceae bacterium]|jgi:very-short-patch-repair endonuclease
MPGRRRETRPGVPFLVAAQLDAAIAELAAAQHAVFSLAQLVALGMTASAVRKRAAVGRLHRVHRGVYSLVPPALLTRNGRFMAAVLACGPGAVLSHRSAANLLGLRASDRATIDVTVPIPGGHRRNGIDIHQGLTLLPQDTTRVAGIPCTTVAPTFLDIATVLKRRGLERAFDQAEVEGLLNLNAIASQVERHPTRRGVTTLRAVLHEHLAGSTFTWSELEERFLALIRSARLPAPEVNAWLDLGDGEPAIRVDFLWRDRRAAVETDGHRTHRTWRATERARRNDQRLTLAGWGHLRLTWFQLTREPERITATVAELLGLGGRLRGCG